MSIPDYIAGFDEEPGYLDFAQFGPMSQRAAGETTLHNELLARARFGAMAPLAGYDEQARVALSQLIAFRPEQIVFQQNSSVALMSIMFGLHGGVLVSPDEFPSATVAVSRASVTTGRVYPVWAATQGGPLRVEHIREAMVDEVTAVVVSLVHYRTGYRTDLAAIRAAIGDRLLIVNASQGFGAVDEDFAEADVVVSNGFKWLRAGHDTGFMALSDRALASIAPTLGSFAGSDADLPLEGEPGTLPLTGTAADFRTGPANPVAHARLAAAVEDLARAGVAEVAAAIGERLDEVLELADQFQIEVASERDPAVRSGIVLLQPAEEELSSLYAALHNHGITVTLFRDAVRLSVHASTSQETMELLRLAFTSFASTRAARRE